MLRVNNFALRKEPSRIFPKLVLDKSCSDHASVKLWTTEDNTNKAHPLIVLEKRNEDEDHYGGFCVQ